MEIHPEALTVLQAVAERETGAGIVGVGELIDSTGLPSTTVVNELERLLREGLVTGAFQRTLSGGDPRPWFVVNPLLSTSGRALVSARAEHHAGPAVAPLPVGRWDAFISHADEDKLDFVAALARELSERGLRIWYDDDILEVGDSVRAAVDQGLQHSDFGIVVISRDYMRKDWTNRELDGLLALESGDKRLLPVWHGVELPDVKAYSPVVAGRFAVRSTIGVPEVADALCRAMKRGNAKDPAAVEHVEDPPPGPVFSDQLRQRANSRAYGWVVIGAAQEQPGSRFTDDEIETCTSWFASLEPQSRVRQATGEFIWSNRLGADAGTALWSGEVHPAPVITVLTAVELRAGEGTHAGALSFEGLVGWWGRILAALPVLAGNLRLDRVRLGFGLYPYDVGGAAAVDIDFMVAPRPVRRAEPHQIAPWSAHTPLFEPFDPPDDILSAPLRDLLDRMSFGRVEPTLRWVAEALARGSLAAYYLGPAGAEERMIGATCRACGGRLRTRELVDPPEQEDILSAVLECSDRNCRVLHDAGGGFVRQHPAIALRNQAV